MVQVGVWGEVDRGLSRTGVQSFALEGTLGELQVWPCSALGGVRGGGWGRVWVNFFFSLHICVCLKLLSNVSCQ